jgi:hypothetical protein
MKNMFYILSLFYNLKTYAWKKKFKKDPWKDMFDFQIF